MRKVFEDNHSPFLGKYRNSLVVDGVSGTIYLYDCDGIWTIIEAPNNDVDCSIPLDITNLMTC